MLAARWRPLSRFDIGVMSAGVSIYPITALTDAVSQLVSDSQLDQVAARPLVQLLEQVRDSLDRDRHAAARGQIGSFVRQVRALVRSGRLSSDDGDVLIGLADGLASQL